MTLTQDVHPDPTAEPPAVTPREPLLRALGEAGGHLTERQLVSTLPYGSAACRRVLGQLETDGLVERLDGGRDRIVSLSAGRPATGRR